MKKIITNQSCTYLLGAEESLSGVVLSECVLLTWVWPWKGPTDSDPEGNGKGMIEPSLGAKYGC